VQARVTALRFATDKQPQDLPVAGVCVGVNLCGYAGFKSLDLVGVSQPPNQGLAPTAREQRRLWWPAEGKSRTSLMTHQRAIQQSHARCACMSTHAGACMHANIRGRALHGPPCQALLVSAGGVASCTCEASCATVGVPVIPVPLACHQTLIVVQMMHSYIIFF
jgi:hypothetical protein